MVGHISLFEESEQSDYTKVKAIIKRLKLDGYVDANIANPIIEKMQAKYKGVKISFSKAQFF